jgi:protein O-GlcNAc transferase
MDSLTEFGKIAGYLKHPLVLTGFVLMMVFSIHKLVLNAGILPKLNQKQGGLVVTLLLRYGFWLGVLIVLLGFGLQFYQTNRNSDVVIQHSKAEESFNINAIVQTLTVKFQQDGQAKDEQIKALTQAVTALSQGKGVSGTESQIKAAMDALAQGKTEQAKALFAKATEKGNQEAKQTAEAYRNLGALAFLDSTQEALQAYRRATQLDPDNTDGWNQLGYLLTRVGDLDAGIAASNKVLASSHDQMEIASAYGNLWMVYRIQGELDKATDVAQKSLKIFESVGSKSGMAKAYAGLGVVYAIRGDWDKGAEFHEKALTLFESVGDKSGMASSYGVLGVVYQNRGEIDKAFEFFQKALKIDESMNNKILIARDYGYLGTIYEARSDWNKAFEFYAKALKLDTEIDRKEGIGRDYGYLGDAYQAHGELDKAIEFYEKALKVDEKLDRKEGMANSYTSLGEVYKLQGNKVEAKRYYQMSIELLKQLGNSEEAKTVQSSLDELQAEQQKNKAK